MSLTFKAERRMWSRLNPCFNGRYSLRKPKKGWESGCPVLILVLMEDTHWENSTDYVVYSMEVLILVLMEDTHWVWLLGWNLIAKGLNPCFNGRYSLRSRYKPSTAKLTNGLNPCFNGRYSLSARRPYAWWTLYQSLNPCFNGRYSLRASVYDYLESKGES